MDRRKFIETTAKGSAMLLAAPGGMFGGLNSAPSGKVVSVSQVKKPLAIAMWDFSWILRHHRYGEFENWNKALEELAERGYNAIRLDVLPQYIVSTPDGKIIDEYRSVRQGWAPAMWGNDYTMTFRPREALLEFMTVCKKYQIQVGLSSWFMDHGTDRKDIFMEEGGLYRAWDETLTFLKNNQMLDNVIYVDILNEFPNWHGYDWFRNEMNLRADVAQYKLNNPEANLPDAETVKIGWNNLQKVFFNQFINDHLSQLKQKYPAFDFFASLESISFDNIDLANFNAMDYHIWFNQCPLMKIPGLEEVAERDQAKFNYCMTMKDLKSFWAANKNVFIEWMNDRLSNISQTAEKYGIVCGNTEGWGPINWYDHPELDWSWVKESAQICIELLQAYPNFKFVCTSNFTHPQHKGCWEDIKWHREMTKKIKSLS